jgi:phosphatidylglycerophosphatase C
LSIDIPSNTKKKLILFDFDGTITTRDTFPLFFKFTFGKPSFYRGFFLHLPLFLFFKLKIYDGGKLKRSILSYYLKNKNRNEIKVMGENYINFLLEEGIIKKEFIEKIDACKNAGYEIAIVSASPDLWIKPFSDKIKIEFLCTELEYVKDIFSGKLCSKNCNYIEKKNRILQRFNLEEFDEIIVYGDSSGDKQMMELATRKEWV